MNTYVYEITIYLTSGHKLQIRTIETELLSEDHIKESMEIIMGVSSNYENLFHVTIKDDVTNKIHVIKTGNVVSVNIGRLPQE